MLAGYCTTVVVYPCGDTVITYLITVQINIICVTVVVYPRGDTVITNI